MQEAIISLDLGIEWKMVEGGIFVMGSGTHDEMAYDDEKPAFEIDVASFEMARYPITNRQYAIFLRESGYEHKPYLWEDRDPSVAPQFSEWPVVGVSWFDGVEFCKWLSERSNDGYDYALPTEEQWEKAARGTNGRIYPWGNEWDKRLCCAEAPSLEPVGIYPDGASPYGIECMAGHVWEWTDSYYSLYPLNEGKGDER